MAACRHLLRSSWVCERRIPAVSRSLYVSTDQSKVRENVGSQGFKEQTPEKLVLFQARYMKPLRLLVRLKIFQLGGFAAIAVPFVKFMNEGTLNAEALGASLGVAIGATGASLALWYYSRRYVGELALLPPYPQKVQLSTVDFWGNRENLQVPLSKIDPPLLNATPTDLARIADNVLMPLPVVGRRQFCIALRYGDLYHKRLLFALLSGTLDATNFEELLDKNTS